MKVFIGIDVSLAGSAFCVLDEHGRVRERAQIAREPAPFIAFLGRLPWPIAAIGLEAGPLSQWLHRGLAEEGFELIIMETRLPKAVLKAMPVKPDRRDAEGLARRGDRVGRGNPRHRRRRRRAARGSEAGVWHLRGRADLV